MVVCGNVGRARTSRAQSAEVGARARFGRWPTPLAACVLGAALSLLACSDPPPPRGEETADLPEGQNAPEVVAASLGSLDVLSPRVPAPAAGTVAALYFVVRNRGEASDTLTAVETPGAASAALHRSLREDGMARMLAAGPVPIPGHGDLVLEPGGLHAMLMGVDPPLAVGDSLPVTLRFARAGDLVLAVPVVSYGDLDASPVDHGQHNQP